jgi:hypothetical protein
MHNRTGLERLAAEAIAALTALAPAPADPAVKGE